MTIQSKEHLLKLVTWGVYFGYSTESIIYFVSRFNDPQSTPDLPFDGTGYIISPQEAETMSVAGVLYQIARERFCSFAFPAFDDLTGLDSDEFDEVQDAELEDMMNSKVHTDKIDSIMNNRRVLELAKGL